MYKIIKNNLMRTEDFAKFDSKRLAAILHPATMDTVAVRKGSAAAAAAAQSTETAANTRNHLSEIVDNRFPPLTPHHLIYIYYSSFVLLFVYIYINIIARMPFPWILRADDTATKGNLSSRGTRDIL